MFALALVANPVDIHAQFAAMPDNFVYFGLLLILPKREQYAMDCTLVVVLIIRIASPSYFSSRKSKRSPIVENQ